MELKDVVKSKKVYANGQVEVTNSEIVTEHKVEIIINEVPVMIVTCTPSDIEYMVLGRLLTEGYITSASDVDSINVCESGHRARVFLKEHIDLKKKNEPQPTCCTGNEKLLSNSEDIAAKKLPKLTYDSKWIFELIGAFAEGSKVHKATKGAHSCYLSFEGKVCFTSEDIGRHNAVDKIVGYALKEGIDLGKCIIFTSGRTPVDMVMKVIRAGIPVLVTKAVPRIEGVELARTYNLGLICKAWPDSYEVYNEQE